MTEVVLTITNAVGLHARPAKEFYQTARAFSCRVTIQNLSRPDSRELTVSPFNLLQSGVRAGHQIRVRADGDDEERAIAAITKLVQSDFGEAPPS